MTAEYGIYFYFLCQQGGDIPPFGAEWGGPDPPRPPHLTEILGMIKMSRQNMSLCHILVLERPNN